jgi:hypothetical protein
MTSNLARLARPLALVAVVLSTLLGGCAVNRATATADPAMQWSTIKSLHIKRLESEDGSTQKLIAKEFKSRGFAVTADPEPAARPDAVVTYVDKWMWDLTMYLLELTIVVRDPKTDFPLAQGNSYHTSLTRKSQEEMVVEVIDNILKTRK